MKHLAILIAMLVLSACSMEASIGRIADINPVQKAQRTISDFIAGEVVTSANGAVVMGTFGEVSERKILSNNVVIEGVFYE